MDRAHRASLITAARDVRFASSRETPNEIESFDRHCLVGRRFDY